MHKRDVGILLLACIAMVLSLQREGVFTFRKAWFHGHDAYGDEQLVEHHMLPAPVVADLNGDGHLEMIVVSPSMKIQVLGPAPPSSVSGGFAAARVIHEASLLDRTVVASAVRRPVAVSVGYLDPRPKHTAASNSGSGTSSTPAAVPVRRKQVIVVVTAGLQVLCYDHNLSLMWEKDISEGLLQRHSRVKEVAVLVTAHRVNAEDRGLIVIGTSVQHGDIASGEGLEFDAAAGSGAKAITEDDEDIFAAEQRGEMLAAQHAHSAGKDAQLEDLDVQQQARQGQQNKQNANKDDDDDTGPTGLDESRHFSYHALEGGQGIQRWQHTATDFHKDLTELAANLRPQHDFRLDAEKLEGRHFGEASCRDYRESILHSALPHAWSDASGTRMVEAHFVKHKVGRGAAKEHLATQDLKGRQQHATASRGHHDAPHLATAHHSGAGGGGTGKSQSALLEKARHRTAGHAGSLGEGGGQGSTHHRHHHTNITANAIVVHLEEGIEVVHLYTGRTICQLHLPPQQLHVDVNGDGVMDHVQVYRGSAEGLGVDTTALASEAGGRRHHAATHCTALTTSGIPPQHHLWQANVCRSSRFLSNLGAGGLDEADSLAGLEILTPVFLPLAKMHQGYSHMGHAHGLVVVLNSRGELHALSARGTPVWQATFPAQWDPQYASEMDAGEAAAAAPVVPAIMPLALHVHGIPSSILAAGQDAAVVVSEHGNLLASMDLPAPPSQKLTVLDFNGDGLNDVVVVTPLGIFGYAQVQHMGGSTLTTLLMVAVAAMGLLLWNHHTSQSELQGPSGRKLRSTEYTD